MADFNKALKVIFKHEGFFSNDPNDRGGATKYGISLRFLSRLGSEGDIDKDGNIDIEDIRALTEPQAIILYKTKFWDKNRYGDIIDNDVACKVFDYAVNIGSKRANLFLQKALKNIYNNTDYLIIDGLIGNQTIDLLNSYLEKYDNIGLLALIDLHVVNFYREIVNKNKSQQKFLLGWLNRVFD